jgi:hypothetical protein
MQISKLPIRIPKLPNLIWFNSVRIPKSPNSNRRFVQYRPFDYRFRIGNFGIRIGNYDVRIEQKTKYIRNTIRIPINEAYLNTEITTTHLNTEITEFGIQRDSILAYIGISLFNSIDYFCIHLQRTTKLAS